MCHLQQRWILYHLGSQVSQTLSPESANWSNISINSIFEVFSHFICSLVLSLWFRKLHRVHMIRVNTLFMNVCFHPAEHQLLACGTDRKISCWEKFDGSMVRDLDGSNTGSINALDISSQGSYFVSAGDDKLVKVG